MPRERIRAFLQGHHRTHRWSPDGREGYEAVELDAAGLRWFRWSHRMLEGGERDVETQSWESFAQSGPLREAPEAVLEAIREAAREHAADPMSGRNA